MCGYLYTASVFPSFQIAASSIAFWNQNIDTLMLLNRHKMYPPRFVIDINGTSAINASCLTVEFTGLRKRVQFQITLSCQRLQQNSSGESSCSNSEYLNSDCSTLVPSEGRSCPMYNYGSIASMGVVLHCFCTAF